MPRFLFEALSAYDTVSCIHICRSQVVTSQRGKGTPLPLPIPDLQNTFELTQTLSGGTSRDH